MYCFRKFAVIVIILIWANQQVLCQDEKSIHFNGDISLTNNGFSLIPLFSLGNPASIIELSVGGERFSFDPQIRVDLEGLKPWSFIFIWRYKVIHNKRFKLRVGMHFPVYVFRSQTVQVNGVSQEKLVSQRFLTPELTLGYDLSKKVNTGIYYLYGRGLEKVDQPKNTHFLSFRVGINQINLSKQVYLKWDPQIYYLNIDQDQGVFLAHTLSVRHRNFPLYLSTMMNKSLYSEIAAKDFDWNINLVYAFRTNFVKKKTGE